MANNLNTFSDDTCRRLLKMLREWEHPVTQAVQPSRSYSAPEMARFVVLDTVLEDGTRTSPATCMATMQVTSGNSITAQSPELHVSVYNPTNRILASGSMVIVVRINGFWNVIATHSCDDLS